MRVTVSRRSALAGSLALPFLARTGFAANAIPLGAINPLTGAGGAYGPSMAKVAEALVARINRTGGVLGRPIALDVEDDQTNPTVGVEAAHKLIDVGKVVAIVGTWASAVTTAVAPLCWQSRTMLFTVSGADSITRLPHHGYIIRTQPNTHLQSGRAAGFLLQHESKRVFGLSAQTPFAVDSWSRLKEVLAKGGATGIGDIIYDPKQTSFRSEIDKALAAKPDTLFLNSYAPDLEILLRETYQAGFNGKRFTFAYAATDAVLKALPAGVTNGLWSFAPSPDVTSPAYKAVQAILGISDPDPYSCQIYDHVALVALAIAKAGVASGVAIHDNVRKISQGPGQKVSDPVAGLKLLAAGKEINYDGASGPCHFTPIGDILNCKFLFQVVENQHNKTLFIS
ncbi:MAG: ABC transporter substrate-binding protein [Rhodospirillales bacterium]|nr:ABC transporter substrate-binding protein [Rhodospirillales bacterium]